MKWALLPFLVTFAACGGDPRVASSASGDKEATSPARQDAATDSLPRIVFLGTSLTAGYGVGADQAYPAVIEKKLESAGLRYEVVNAGVSGETSAGGRRRLEWLLQKPVDVLVVELGANDGLRGLGIEALRENLQSIVQRTKSRYADARVVIVGMEAPPNLGPVYTQSFSAVYRDVAAATGSSYVPFLLEGVGGVAELNQADRIHPTAEGQRILAENVWRVLGPMLAAR